MNATSSLSLHNYNIIRGVIPYRDTQQYTGRSGMCAGVENISIRLDVDLVLLLNVT